MDYSYSMCCFLLLFNVNEIHCFVKLKRNTRKEQTSCDLSKLAKSSSAKDCPLHFGFYPVFFAVTAVNCFSAINNSLIDHHHHHHTLQDIVVKSVVECSGLCIHTSHSEVPVWLLVCSTTKLKIMMVAKSYVINTLQLFPLSACLCFCLETSTGELTVTAYALAPAHAPSGSCMLSMHLWNIWPSAAISPGYASKASLQLLIKWRSYLPEDTWLK